MTVSETFPKHNISEIILYQNENHQIELLVLFDGDTIWLTQSQMVELFSSSKANISEHITQIFKSTELDKDSTVREFRTVRKEGSRNVARTLEYYNLDVIISVGYRVNTKRGVQFRQWATQRLKEHLVKGYSINQKRLDELQQTIQLVRKTISEKTNLSEAKGLLKIIQQYTQSFILLNQFDSDAIVSEN